MIRHISILLLFAFTSGLYAQKQDSVKALPKSAQKQVSSGKTSDKAGQKPDSVKVVMKQDSIKMQVKDAQLKDPVRKPGKADQKKDSLILPRIVKQWNMSADFSDEAPVEFDTVFSLFNRFRISDRYSPVNANLGNYGLPFYQISFFDRITDPDKFLASPFYHFIYLPENALFMNTQVPFTELKWTIGGQREIAEQTFRVRHSQNINRYFNFGIIYDIIFSLGQYSYQRAEDKAFTFYSSYIGPKYKLYFSAGINGLLDQENGGITAKDELDLTETRDIPVNLGALNNAASHLKNRNLLLVQRYTFEGNPALRDSISGRKEGSSGLSGTFSHIFLFEQYRRSYSDETPGSGFYDTIYLNNEITFDSIYSRSIKNTVRFDFATDETRKFRLGGGFGFRNELFRYNQISPSLPPYIVYNSISENSNNAVVGRLFNSIGDKFLWSATGELFLTGYRAGDLILDGVITKSFDLKKGRASWLITGAMKNMTPSYWYSQWGSNHFEWHNNLEKEFRLDIGSKIIFPVRKTEVKFNYAILNNYTYLNSGALPSQYSSGLSVAALSVRNELSAWKFHLVTDLILQQSSNSEVLDLPLFTVRSAAYFEHLFRFEKTQGKLNTQLGVDVTYHSLYHSYGYMPSTGRFYQQGQYETGNYPFINLFLNIKLQRTRFFFMFDHLNQGMMGNEISYNYDLIYNYPQNRRMFRFGVAWTFYN